MELLKKLQSTKLATENLSPTRNIERAYESLFISVFGESLDKKSDEWKIAKDKMKLFSLAYALAKKDSPKTFPELQKALEMKLIELRGTMDLGEDNTNGLIEVVNVLLKEVYGELREGKKLHILENIIGVDTAVQLGKTSVPRVQSEFSHEILKVRGEIKNESGILANKTNDNSVERGVEKYYKKIKDKCFTKEEKEDSDKLAQTMQMFNVAHIICKYKFSHERRSSGERYFDHLLAVVDLYLENEENPTFEGVMIALLHDIVEDTDIDWETLDYLFGGEIASGVCNLSKPSVRQYIDEGSDDENFFKKHIKSGFLNAKGLVSDATKKTKNNKTWSLEEQKVYKEYQEIHQKYKEQRNKGYFEKFKKWGMRYYLSEEDKRSILVKCYDRIHNTQTLMGFGMKNIDKIFAKIDETIEYFLPVTEKNFPEIHEILLKDLEGILSKIKNSEDITVGNKQHAEMYLSEIGEYKLYPLQVIGIIENN